MPPIKLHNVIELFIVIEKYDYVGRLLKPGEQPTNYSDEEDEPASGDKSKDD